jgi:hypothetical protein
MFPLKEPCFNKVDVAGSNVLLTGGGGVTGVASSDLLHAEKNNDEANDAINRMDFMIYAFGVKKKLKVTCYSD